MHNQNYIFYSYYRNPRPAEETIAENLERLKNIFSSGLCEALQTKTIIEMRHDVLRQILTKKNLVFNQNIYLEEADFNRRYFPVGWHTAYVTKRGDQRSILFPIAVRLFLARSRKLYCAEGKELPRRWIEKLSISFVKQTHWMKTIIF